RYGLPASLQGLDPLHCGPQKLLHPGEALPPLGLADLEDPRLGLVKQLGGCELSLERLRHNRGGRLDEPAEQRLLTYDPRVVLHVRGCGSCVHQEADVLATAYRVHFTAAGELIDERERVHHIPPLAEGDHRTEDPSVPLTVEHRVVHMFGGSQDRVTVHEHRRDNRLLRVCGVRRLSVSIRVTYRSYREVYGRAGHLPM